DHASGLAEMGGDYRGDDGCPGVRSCRGAKLRGGAGLCGAYKQAGASRETGSCLGKAPIRNQRQTTTNLRNRRRCKAKTKNPATPRQPRNHRSKQTLRGLCKRARHALGGLGGKGVVGPYREDRGDFEAIKFGLGTKVVMD